MAQIPKIGGSIPILTNLVWVYPGTSTQNFKKNPWISLRKEVEKVKKNYDNDEDNNAARTCTERRC